MKRETQDPPVQRRRSRSRIGLPLCIGVSFALHAGLMAMSSMWMSGGVSLARGDEGRTPRPDDEELDTIAIYVRIPEAGGAGHDDARGLAGESSTGDGSDGGASTLRATIARPAGDDGNVESAPGAEAALGSHELASASAPAAIADLPLPASTEPPAGLVQAQAAAELEDPLESSGAPAPPFAALLPSAPLSNGAFANPPVTPDTVASADPTQAASNPPNTASLAPSASLPTRSSSAGTDASGGSAAGAGSAGAGQGTAGAGDGRGEGGDGTAEPGAVLTYGPRPEYPATAVRHGEEGRVLCEIHIDATGHVTRVGVLQSSGHPRLDQAALDGLAKWRFRPARKDGRAVACRVPHCVTFRLE